MILTNMGVQSNDLCMVWVSRMPVVSNPSGAGQFLASLNRQFEYNDFFDLRQDNHMS
jgi:hypothetical protein